MDKASDLRDLVELITEGVKDPVLASITALVIVASFAKWWYKKHSEQADRTVKDIDHMIKLLGQTKLSRDALDSVTEYINPMRFVSVVMYRLSRKLPDLR